MRRLSVLSCPESWDRMRPDGDDGRLCERCQLRVSDVAKLDAHGLDELTEAAASERVCVRFELDRGRPRTALGLAAGLVVVALAGCATAAVESLPPSPPIDLSDIEEGSGGVIAGAIRTPEGHAAAGALVILQSAALPSQFELLTDERGIYRFTNLPPGNYTIQVLFGKANVSKVTQLPEDARYRANFTVNPDQDNQIIIGMLVERPMLDITSAGSTYSSRLVEYY
jgi:hypothetical protein